MNRYIPKIRKGLFSRCVLPVLGIIVLFSYQGQAQATDSLELGRGGEAHKPDSGIKWLSPVNPLLGDSLPLAPVRDLPYSYLGQFMDGMIPGMTTIRPSGEPGVASSILIRGLSVPLGSVADLYANQPLYVVNGIPLIRNDNPYQLKIKQYDLTGIGSGIDISSMIDMYNVARIELVKGAEAVSLYGQHASNGAIVITTRRPDAGKYHIALNLYGGVALEPPVNTQNSAMTINGNFERDFLLPFYNKYGDQTNWANFPAYLADSTHAAYFGPANWTDLYYREALQHGMGLSITGGSELASFRFGVAEHTENGVVDHTALKRYNVYYDMYMSPFSKLMIHTFVQAATAERNRNNSLRERYAEEEYFPNQDYPLPPNSDYLESYYGYLDETIDQNKANSIQALAQAQYQIGEMLSVNSAFSVDYNDNHRNFFIPGSLNDGNSFTDYFSGINRRILWKNFLLYSRPVSGDNRLRVEIGQSLEYNRMQYSYIKGYRGPSDFIKMIQVGTNSDGSDKWITHDKTLVYGYKDYMKQRLFSFYGNASYQIKDKYSATLFLRSDGSSYYGNGYYWAISPAVALSWNLKKEAWLQSSDWIDDVELSLTGGRTTREPALDYYGYGPYYTVDIGWTGSEKVSSYASFPTLSLPFSEGYVGGGIKQPYTDQWNIGLKADVLKVIHAELNVYGRTSRNLIIPVPAGSSYGFSKQWVNGMDVRNSGVELNAEGRFNLSTELKWTSGAIFQYNTSKVTRLPNGLQAITYGNRRLSLGKPADQFWLLQNAGIYNSESDIPVSSGEKLSYNGIPFQVGDPRWTDINKDGVIDDDDRVMEGHILPPVHGAWHNGLEFKNWTFRFSFIYSMGNSILNGAMANRFDFANNQGAAGLNGVKELTFWQVKGNLNIYPKYNPWSLVDPYQTDQTLFFEKAGYIKLQSVSLQYDLTPLSFVKKSKIKRLEIYVTGTNLFLQTQYRGNDPSLVDYFGYDYGYAQPLPVTFTLGIHADF